MWSDWYAASAAASKQKRCHVRRSSRRIESFLQHGIESLSGGGRHQIIVHVDADTLGDRTAGSCELEEGPSLVAETARRFACDGSVVALIENGQGEPLNAGRKTRTISSGVRRVLCNAAPGKCSPFTMGRSLGSAKK